MTTSCNVSTENKCTLTVEYQITDENGTKRQCDSIVAEKELQPYQVVRRHKLGVSPSIQNITFEGMDETKDKIVQIEITSALTLGITVKLGDDISDPTLEITTGEVPIVIVHKLTNNILQFVNNETSEIELNILVGDIE